jgi:hypothetical protein
MSSAAQVLANRQNSIHSTGPVTPEGKAASSRNSLKHGLTSKQIVLPGEDAAEYDAIRESLIKTYAPANEIERTLVEEIAASNWRLMRVRRQETHILGSPATATIQTLPLLPSSLRSRRKSRDSLATSLPSRMPSTAR